MIERCEGPPRPGSADGLDECSCLGGENGTSIAPQPAPTQAEILRFPRAVRPRCRHIPPPRRLEVRIAANGRDPIGCTRPFRLTRGDLDELIAAAVRMERP